MVSDGAVKTWLAQLARLWQTAPPATRRRFTARRARLGLEFLEERAMLNAKPITNPDFGDTDGANPVTIQVLTNDRDPDLGDTLKAKSVTVKTLPLHGFVGVDRTTGEITFTPKNGFTGTDSFTYTVKDNHGKVSKPATVTVIVHTPTANDDFADTDGVNPVVIDVLENDTDPDGALLASSVRIRRAPLHGAVAIDPSTGEITYTPAARFGGSDSFTYLVNDEHGAASNEATVSVIVHQPKANDDFRTMTQPNSVLIDVLENDTDPDGALDPTSVHLSAQPAHGMASVNHSTGEVTYTPAAGFAGTDTFRYTVTDEHGAKSDPGTVTIVVLGSGTLGDDVADTDGINPVDINVLANDGGAGGISTSTLRVAQTPQHGRVTVSSSTGVITYTPSADFSGTDVFKYQVDGLFVGGAKTLEAQVSVIVHQPTANDDFADTDGTNPVEIEVLENDTDPDGALVASSARVISGPTHGQVTVDHGTGAITYTPKNGFGGTDAFFYAVTDAHGATSNIAQVTLIVHQPKANDDFAETTVGQAVIISVLENDTDPDGALDPTSVLITRQPLHGTLDVLNGQVTYTPAPGFFGADVFAYVMKDEHGAQSKPATVTVNVLA